ncbi:RNA polymerase sigma factor [Paenibacillus antri]|uniref:RNA polymerase sigma factor n=1 Tax=Paenibacillus antri TaxID=2582848 RepID=A0A5R9G535_9BACL|nr:RNA polymerase sigma factor [Paenibacillus antri]TLS50891.1 RNA polymerase sigma factor [Paenibacillus antri]
MTTSIPESPGEHNALALLARIGPELRAYCRSLCGDDWEADDLAQEATLKTIDRWRAEPARPLTKAYVYRAARNVWIDRCRSRARRPAVPLETLGREPAAAEAPDPAATRELLERLMRLLPPKPFVALLLCDVFGWTAGEAGARIDMAEGAVQATLSRARRRLRELADLGGSERPPPEAGAAGASAGLLEAAAEAFRRHDPHLIYDAYLRIRESGSRMTDVRVREGRLYFAIRDRDGISVMIGCD